MNNDILQAIVVGIISGAFSAGTIWGILKTELFFLRRDVNELRNFVFKIGD